ncbi:MAG TPA: hypothetical protein VF755_25475 [Catenuloplanes sp.]
MNGPPPTLAAPAASIPAPRASPAPTAAPTADLAADRTAPTADQAADRTADLVGRLRPGLPQPVDGLQVAAVLESDGITDEKAASEYGHPDVFSLADDVLHRLRRAPVPAAVSTSVAGPGGGRLTGLREASHSVLYLLPLALFPPALALIDRRPTASLVILVVGGFGWVWSGVAAWLAYQLLGQGSPGAAARLLRWATMIALVVAAGVAGTVWFAGSGGAEGTWPARTGAGEVVGLAVGQCAYQLALILALFYRRELWLIALMTPGVAVGAGHLLVGWPSAGGAAAVAAGSVAAGLGLALRQTAGHPRAAATVRDAGWAARRELPVVLLYTALSAAVMLFAQARYLNGDVGVLLAGLPLFAGMGVVEWRARRFDEQARAVLHRVRYPGEFVRQARRALVAGLLGCMVALGVIAAPVLLVLRAVGLLSPAAVVMAGAHVVLGGAYFLAFVLAGQHRYPPLCGALAVALATHVGIVAFVPGADQPLPDTVVFLGSVVLLQALLLVSLTEVVGQAWRFR